MATIDELILIDGFFKGNKFIMRGICGTAVYGANGIRSFGRLIEGKDPVTITLDKENKLYIPVDMNGQIAKELLMIADELEKKGCDFITGSVDREKNGKNNVNNNPISIHFNSKLAM